MQFNPLAIGILRGVPLLFFCSLLLAANFRIIIGMMNKSQIMPFIVVLGLLVFLTSAVSAIPYKVGDYTVDVEVRNKVMNLIPGAKVRCYLNSNNTITVKAEAIGYVSYKKKVTLYENQNFYKCDLWLDDMKHRVAIIDLNQDIISSAYARTDQYGVPGDKFGVSVFIPKTDWPAPTAENVDIVEPFYGLPFKKTCVIKEIDEFYQADINIERKALEWCGGDILVVFRTKVPNRPEIIAGKIGRLNGFSAGNSNDAARYELSRYLSRNYAPAELRNAVPELPESLEIFVAAAEKFNRLHRENF